LLNGIAHCRALSPFAQKRIHQRASQLSPQTTLSRVQIAVTTLLPFQGGPAGASEPVPSVTATLPLHARYQVLYEKGIGLQHNTAMKFTTQHVLY
jgi:hypothetical protein